MKIYEAIENAEKEISNALFEFKVNNRKLEATYNEQKPALESAYKDRIKTPQNFLDSIVERYRAKAVELTLDQAPYARRGGRLYPDRISINRSKSGLEVYWRGTNVNEVDDTINLSWKELGADEEDF